MTQNLKEKINNYYGNRIRVRVCGVLIKSGKLLILKHEGVGKIGYFWNVPGGEAEKQEPLCDALLREFKEECGLEVSVGKLITHHEYIAPPLHAVELYFEVKSENENAELGFDTEPIKVLSELKWMTKEDLEKIHPAAYPQFLIKHLNFDN